MWGFHPRAWVKHHVIPLWTNNLLSWNLIHLLILLTIRVQTINEHAEKADAKCSRSCRTQAAFPTTPPLGIPSESPQITEVWPILSFVCSLGECRGLQHCRLVLSHVCPQSIPHSGMGQGWAVCALCWSHKPSPKRGWGLLSLALL